MFMHFLCICLFLSSLFFVIWLWCVLFSLSLSLSLSDKLRYGTQSMQIHSSSKSSSRFWVFFFWSSRSPPPCSVLWWEGPKGLLRELPETWHSFGTPGYPVELCRHSSPFYHSNSGLGISSWEILEVSCHVYIGVLLQYTQRQYLCTLVCYYIQRYTYNSYSGSYIRGTTHY